ncbi:Chloramphenicol phosphotransferase-like protein [compost metagenome]
MRDWIIDCAVRWQRRNKLVVARPMGGDDVPAAIGPRDAALKPLLATADEAELVPVSAIALAADPEVPTHAEAPIEQTLIVPAPAPALPEPADEVAILTESDAVEPVTDTVPVEPQAELPADEPIAEPDPVTSGAVERRAPSVPNPALAAESVIPAAVENAPVRPTIELGEMTDWQILILSGPAGSGKSSIAQQFCEVLPRAVHIKVEPLRDRAYSVLVARPFGESAQDSAMPEVWSGPTEEARQQAADLGMAYSHTGHRVIIDDVIESPADLQIYQTSLADRQVRIVSLMPGLDELERRDKMLPVGQQQGTRLKEFHANMVRQLGAHSTVLDISQETAPETVQRIVGLLQPQA